VRARPPDLDKSAFTESIVPGRGVNLERKLRLDREVFESVRGRLSAMVPLTAMTQVDSYFRTRHGRLKLREIVPAAGVPSAELIAYERLDRTGSRWSSYYRLPLAPAQVGPLRAALVSVLGLRVEVHKHRTVGVIGRTRVHLDDVRGLGHFVELETVTGDPADRSAGAEIDAVMAMLGIEGAESIAGSYADLVATGDDDPDVSATSRSMTIHGKGDDT
jgi:hypothetical protein